MFVILRPCLCCRPVVSQQVLAIESLLPYMEHRENSCHSSIKGHTDVECWVLEGDI